MLSITLRDGMLSDNNKRQITKGSCIGIIELKYNS